MQTITMQTGNGLSESELMNAAEAAPERLYDTIERRLKEGRGARKANPRYLKLFAEAATIYAEALSGNRWKTQVFKEAMKTSDFTHLFGDVLQRQMLDMYAEFEVDYPAYAKAGRVRDFRTVKRIAVDGATGALPAVAQGDSYQPTTLSETEYEYTVGKYGQTEEWTWEMQVNDDLDSLSTLPARNALAARNTEQKFATMLYAMVDGPNETFFTTAHKNLLEGASSALSVASLEAAFKLLGQQVDPSGSPIYVNRVTLVVPPALEVTARNLLSEGSTIFIASGSGSATSNQVQAPNWMRQKIETLVVNPWLPLISTGSEEGETSWYLFADPRSGGRPAMEVGKLIGHEEPELFVKSPDAMRIGGGLIDPADGSFTNDGVAMKVRHVVGGVLLDHRVAVASRGTVS